MKQGNFSPTNAESAQKTSFGMGFMIKEIQNDDGTVSRTFGLSRHVLFTGALISKLNIFPISGTKMPILIDQANPTPDYWSVTSNSDPTSESEIATFTITEPTTDDSLTSNTPVEFDTTPLSQGDEILALESTDATNDVLMATTMKIDQVIYDKKGHPIYVAKGSATQGASGGAVWRNGKIVGIIQWGPFGQPDETTIYPFTNEDIDYINSQQ